MPAAFGHRQILVLSGAGCLLPLLIFLNSFFGWMFFRLSAWLVIEVFLIILLFLTSFLIKLRIRRMAAGQPKAPNEAIDTDAEVME